MTPKTPARTPKTGLPDTALAQLRLHAVQTRNRAYDGEFYYGVTTTGVFCVPSCPSRHARPQNLRFFATTHDATAAGFRACRRCHPLQPRTASAAAAAIRDVCGYIAAHAAQPLPLARLAAVSGFSAAHLQRTFKAEVGISPKEFQSALRVAQFKKALRAGSRVTDATYVAGFGSTSRVYGAIDGALGMTPSAYRAGGAGEVIDYACRVTVLGQLMMAATARGVCFVQFGASATELEKQLRAEFPNATLRHSDAESGAALDAWLVALNSHLAGYAPRPDLPLDIRGTAFQVRVWQCLLSIREGEVVSYSELAARLGTPRAVRAVASACARNRIGVLIPCHRVLRGDGSLGGYRWGLERKRALIDAERARSKSPP